MNSFLETGLNDNIIKAVQELGFEKPTPIQAKTIPHLLTSDQDIIASAQTGTGKTAAFGLPSIHLTDVDNKQTQTLVLSPTRELCLQITNDLTSYAKYIKGLSVVAVYGGANIDTQIRALNKGAQIVVATPGRAKDLIKRKKLILGSVERVILDEADEMLSMGFKDDLDDILAQTPETKQTLLFSATMSKEILNITKKYMQNAVEMSVAKMNVGATNVSHIYYMVNAKDRYEVLKRISDMNPNIYGIVFCRTRRETKEVANKLMQDGYNADALHGDLSQAQRDEVMARFRSKHLQMLVATDVAARGLDVNELTHVINYNLPDDNEVYTHRSGRTGRAGNTGISIVIIHSRESRKLKDIERYSKINFTKEQVPSGKDICTKQLYSLIDKIEKVEVEEKQIEPFLPEIYRKLEWLDREQLIKHFVSAEFNRFLAYYKGARDINLSEKGGRDRDRGDRDERSSRGERGEKRSSRERSNTPFARLFINVGSKDNLVPARLIGLINEGLDSGNVEIGKIDVMKKFTFFEIDEKYAPKLMKALSGASFEGVPLSVEIAADKPVTSNDSYYKRTFGGDHAQRGDRPRGERKRKDSPDSSKQGSRKDRRRRK